MAFIYILENKINGKMYVGQTVQNIEKRIGGHARDSKRRNYPIASAIKKYGINNFSVYSFEYEEKDIDFYERVFIRILNTLYPCGYNLESGGNKNKHLSLETKKKIGIANSGNKYHLGYHHDEESKRKISIVHKGKIIPDYVREKMRISHIGIHAKEKHPMWGRHHTKEACMRISKKVKGENNPRYGVRLSEETKNKISIKNKKKVMCIDTKKIYLSITDAARENNCSISNISQCCRGKSKTANNLCWKYYTGVLNEKKHCP